MSTFDNDLANAKKLLDTLGSDHPRYLDAHTLYKRLEENISNSILYGDTDKRASSRAEIRYGLDKISLEVYNYTTDYIGKKASSLQTTSPNPGSKPEPSTPDREAYKSKNKFVFISHTSQDDDFVARLAKDIKTARQNVWHDGQDIKVSQSIPGEINKALANCEYLIIVLSPESVKSHWVLQELEAAFAMKKTIVPVLLRDCERPALIQQVKYADFRKDYQGGFADLLSGLGIPKDHDSGNPQGQGYTSGLSLIFENIERAGNSGDLPLENRQFLNALFKDIAAKKYKGEIPMAPADPEIVRETFSYTSQILVYDLISLSDYHAEWSNMVVSDSFKKDSIKLLKKMQQQVLVSSALARQARKIDYTNETEKVLKPLKSLQSILMNIDDHLLAGKVPFSVTNDIERYFDDLTYHLNKYLLLLHELDNSLSGQRLVQ